LHYFQRFANDKVIFAYCSLLEHFKDNEDEVNLMIVKLFHRVFIKLNVQPLFYKLSIFTLFRDILDSHLQTPAINELKKFFEYVLVMFFKALEKNPILYIELLYPKTATDINRIQYGDQKKGLNPDDFNNDIDDDDLDATEPEPAVAKKEPPKLPQLEVLGEPSLNTQLDAITIAFTQEHVSHYLIFLKGVRAPLPLFFFFFFFAAAAAADVDTSVSYRNSMLPRL